MIRRTPGRAPARLAALALALTLGGAASAEEPARAVEGAEPAEREASFLLNVKLGPSIGLRDLPTQLALQIEIGVSLTPDGRGYLILPLQLHIVHEPTALILPLGFQYDIPLVRRSLYLSPRLSLGYAALFDAAGTISHMGVAIPELGLKYVTRRRFSFGIEPFSLPLLFDGSRLLISYRVLGYAGVRF